jgi:Peptidase family M23
MKTKQIMVPMMVITFVLMPLIARAVYAQVCTVNSPQGPVVIYDELLLPGWSTSGSWSIATPINMQAAPGGQDGNHALQVDFTTNWAGIELHHNNVDTAFLKSLVFRVRQEGSGVLYAGLRLTSTNALHNWVALGSYIVANQTVVMSSGQWYTVRIPLSDIGAPSGTLINGVLIESSTPMTIYLDDIGMEAGFLQFPLAGKTPYTMRTVAIQDHDLTVGIVRAFDGEIGSGSSLCYDQSCQQIGFLRSDSSGPFVLPHLTYDEETPVPGHKDYIWYDNHTGYDYAESGMDTGSYPVYAAASGYLCVGNNTTTGNGSRLWRNPSNCTVADAATTTRINSYTVAPGNTTTQWDYFHAIYIVHGNSYSSWYLHIGDILSALRWQIVQNGYAWVNQGDQIATVGNFAYGQVGGVHYHLHFGVRNPTGARIDPYGDGTPGNFNILWQQRPQSDD